MPGFDGTGPRGMGPMTGGGRGFCSPWGIGAARRAGVVPPYAWMPYPFYGATWGAPYYGATATPGAVPYAPQMTREQELDFLRSQTEMMRGQLEQIESRMRDLEAGE